jgi:4-amino-4-deoxy-L-arabinose transferase-like glycosyltransferase
MSRKNPTRSTIRKKEKGVAATPDKSKRIRTSPSGAAPPTKTPSALAKIDWAYPMLFVIVGSAVVCGTILMYLATRHGIGVTADSTVYLKVARNLLSGQGFAQSAGAPVTQYPPLYPVALALSGLFQGDLLTGAKWLHFFIYVANLLLAALLVYRGTRGSLAATAAGLLFLLTSGHFLLFHVMTLSEAPFLFFCLAGLVVINEYLYRKKLSILVAVSIIIGLACMTRYIGIILIGVIGLSILLLEESSWKKKVISISIVATIFILPIILWIIRNLMVSGMLVNRRITYHPIKIRQIEGAVVTISKWFCIPVDTNIAIKVIILAIAILLVVIILYEMIKYFGIYSNLNRAPLICAIFLCLYVGGLVLSIFFVEANLPFGDRILFPFHVVLGLGLIMLGRNALQLVSGSRWWTGLAIVLCTSLLIASGGIAVQVVDDLNKNGVGYSNNTWKSSKAMEFIKALPDDVLVYSNGPDVIDLLIGRQTMMIPGKRHSASNDVNPSFSKEVDNMLQRLEDSKGFLVYFSLISWRKYLSSAEELKQRAELQAVYEGRDGIIYQVVRRTN